LSPKISPEEKKKIRSAQEFFAYTETSFSKQNYFDEENGSTSSALDTQSIKLYNG
jgi:hypothetical protein